MISFSECSTLGKRPETHPTTPSHRIEWLYTYTAIQYMWDHLSISQWCPPSLMWARKLFSQLTTNWYLVPVPWVGNESQALTTHPGAEWSLYQGMSIHVELISQGRKVTHCTPNWFHGCTQCYLFDISGRIVSRYSNCFHCPSTTRCYHWVKWCMNVVSARSQVW
jgi:hypothetical protein